MWFSQPDTLDRVTHIIRSHALTNLTLLAILFIQMLLLMHVAKLSNRRAATFHRLNKFLGRPVPPSSQRAPIGTTLIRRRRWGAAATMIRPLIRPLLSPAVIRHLLSDVRDDSALGLLRWLLTSGRA